MADIEELKGYFKKLKRVIDAADLTIFGKKLVKKSRVDDLLCCVIATLPDSFKATMKKRMAIDAFPSVSSYNRLSKIIKKPFFLSQDYYIFSATEAITLLQNINKHLESDIRKLEES